MIRHDSWRYPPPLRIRGPASWLRQTGLFFCTFFRRRAASSAQKPQKSAISVPAPARKKCTLAINSQIAPIDGRTDGAARPRRRKGGSRQVSGNVMVRHVSPFPAEFQASMRLPSPKDTLAKSRAFAPLFLPLFRGGGQVGVPSRLYGPAGARTPPSTSLRSATSPSEEGEGQVCGGLAVFAEESPRRRGIRAAPLGHVRRCHEMS